MVLFLLPLKLLGSNTTSIGQDLRKMHKRLISSHPSLISAMQNVDQKESFGSLQNYTTKDLTPSVLKFLFPCIEKMVIL